MASGQSKCKGVIHTNQKCRLSRDGSGNPMQVKKCGVCKEIRCRTHCRCGRNHTAVGRRAPRPRATPVQALPQLAVCQSASCAPVGRPATTEVKVLVNQEWMQSALEEIRQASGVDLAMCVFDSQQILQALLSRLKDRTQFSCSIVVDQSSYDEKASTFQRSRLLQLQGCGARVVACRGFDASYLYGSNARKRITHLKCLVIDKRLAFAGTANVTTSSRSNREAVFKFRGPSVQQILWQVLPALENGRGPVA